MNGWEAAGRERKAQRIARVLAKILDKPETLVSMVAIEHPEAEEQAIAAAAAGVKMPSEATWARVVEILHERGYR